MEKMMKKATRQKRHAAFASGIACCAMLACMTCGCMTGKVPAYSQQTMANATRSFVYDDAETSISLKCRMLVPDTSVKLPVVLFLHGAGQRGEDNVAQLSKGDAGHLMLFASEHERAVVLAPQCPAGRDWSEPDMTVALSGLVKHVLSSGEVKTNPDRVYVTGFSMGGYGTWKLVLSCPSMFAAALPVCGGPLAGVKRDIPDVPAAMSSVHIWSFSSYDDDVV